MTSPQPSNPISGRALRILATVVAGVLTLFLVNSFSGSSTDPQQVSTASLFGVPGTSTDDAAPIATTVPVVAQTAPLQLPTATPEPTPVPTSTPAPEPTAVPPTPVPPAPEPAAAEPAPVVETAPAEPPAAAAAVPQADAPEVQATPAAAVVPEPTATPVAAPAPSIDVQPSVEPTPVVAADIEVVPTATVEPTPIPTATPEPLVSIADLETYVLGEINGVRAQAGLGPVALDSSVSNISRDWSQQMASGGFFSHRPSDQLNTMLPSGWRQWGENIASAPDIYWAQSSLENSPGHFANMVGSFTHVGIGVYRVDGKVWVTQNFVQY